MQNILDNELVCKYFGEITDPGIWKYEIAYNILQAMQEPIRRIDKYLCIHRNEKTGEISFCEARGNISLENHWHPECLRLPDKFQHQHDWKCECGAGLIVPETDKSQKRECEHPTLKHEVDLEAKVRRIWVNCTQNEGVKRIVELVRLAVDGK